MPSRSFFMTNVVANRVLIPLLRSPLGSRLGGHLAVVDYKGRRSGHPHQLVTQYVVEGDTVRIEVGAAERKTWWRNFQSAGRMSLRLAGRDRNATAHVMREGGQVSVVAVLDDQRSGPLVT